jgi:hypothetical protein
LVVDIAEAETKCDQRKRDQPEGPIGPIQNHASYFASIFHSRIERSQPHFCPGAGLLRAIGLPLQQPRQRGDVAPRFVARERFIPMRAGGIYNRPQVGVVTNASCQSLPHDKLWQAGAGGGNILSHGTGSGGERAANCERAT